MSTNNIEDVFKSGFADEQEAYQQSDWDKMSRLLDASGAPPAQQPATNGRRRLLLGLLALVFISGAVWMAVSRNSKKQAVLAQTDKAVQTADAGATTSGAGTGNSGTTDADNLSPSSASGNSLPLDSKTSGNSSDTAVSWKYDTSYVSTGPARGSRQTVNGQPAGGNNGIGKDAAGNSIDLKDIAGIANGNVVPQLDQAVSMKVRKTKVVTVKNRGGKNGSGNKVKIAKQIAEAATDEALPEDKTVTAAVFKNRLQQVSPNPEKTAPEKTGSSGTEDTITNIAMQTGITAPEAIKSGNLNAADSLVLKTPDITSNNKKDKKAKGFARKVLGLPQWISAGVSFAPIAANNYEVISSPQGTSYPPRFVDSAIFNRLGSIGFNIAIGSEWFPMKSEKWSLNSYLMLQHSKTWHVAQSTRIEYGTSVKQYDTVVDIDGLVAARLGADWIHHSPGNRLQWGGGLNVQYLAISRGNKNYYENSPNGGLSFGEASNGLFNGLNRWNIGLTASFNYRIARSIFVDFRAGYDFWDMTSNSYYKNTMRNNLSYVALGLKWQLNKQD